MKMTSGSGYGALGCALKVSDNLKVSSEVDCGELAEETIGYAVCRFLMHSRLACDRYVTLSYHKRFGRGKRRVPCCCHLELPASALGLPGKWASIVLSVDAIGVVVESVSLCAERPDRQFREK